MSNIAARFARPLLGNIHNDAARLTRPLLADDHNYAEELLGSQLVDAHNYNNFAGAHNYHNPQNKIFFGRNASRLTTNPLGFELELPEISWPTTNFEEVIKTEGWKDIQASFTEELHNQVQQQVDCQEYQNLLIVASPGYQNSLTVSLYQTPFPSTGVNQGYQTPLTVVSL